MFRNLNLRVALSVFWLATIVAWVIFPSHTAAFATLNFLAIIAAFLLARPSRR